MNSQEDLQAEIAKLRLQVKFLAKLVYEYKEHGFFMVEFAESIKEEEREKTMKELEKIWKD